MNPWEIWLAAAVLCLGLIWVWALWKIRKHFLFMLLLAGSSMLLLLAGGLAIFPSFLAAALPTGEHVSSSIQPVQPAPPASATATIATPPPTVLPNFNASLVPVAVTATPNPAIIPTFTPGPATFRPITWMQLVQFLDADHTNWNKYDPAHYNCVDFSVDLVANALKQDIQAWVVGITFTQKTPDHAIVGFWTTDQGIVYIEPQTDNPYWGLAVGQPLCDSWGVYQCLGTVASMENMQCNHQYYCMKYTPVPEN